MCTLECNNVVSVNYIDNVYRVKMCQLETNTTTFTMFILTLSHIDTHARSLLTAERTDAAIVVE
jgi:hypothetical protein